MAFASRGLSPLARGKRRVLRCRCGPIGPIPAGAGETRRRWLRQAFLRAYPRWRGGNCDRDSLIVDRKGLSPLARGKRYCAMSPSIRSGPIPAGAGETERTRCPPCGLRAYPRWRGGNPFGTAIHRTGAGLSPLARGKPSPVPLAAPRRGPIPAGAGETTARRRSHFICWAYPRWRGGNQAAAPQEQGNGGLSPLARGKRATST